MNKDDLVIRGNYYTLWILSGEDIVLHDGRTYSYTPEIEFFVEDEYLLEITTHSDLSKKGVVILNAPVMVEQYTQPTLLLYNAGNQHCNIRKMDTIAECTLRMVYKPILVKHRSDLWWVGGEEK